MMFKKLRKKKIVVLSATQKIEKANGIVEESLGMFKKAVDQIDQANSLLEQSVGESESRINYLKSSLQATETEKQTAEQGIESNLMLREKLNQFIIR